MKHLKMAAFAAMAGAALSVSPAAADSVADFYSGRTITTDANHAVTSRRHPRCRLRAQGVRAQSPEATRGTRKPGYPRKPSRSAQYSTTMITDGLAALNIEYRTPISQ